MEIRFVSTGKKFKETIDILAIHNIEVIPIQKRLMEQQTEDVKKLLEDKVIQAFEITGRPVFVEHTGLYLDALSGLPGGLTRLFWERLKEEAFCEFFGKCANPGVTAKTMIAYCNSKTITYFCGEIRGRISTEPRGSGGFEWDRVFIPNQDPDGRTFAELGDDKNKISMRRLALEKFASFLTGN